LVENHQFEPTPPLYVAPFVGDPVGISPRCLHQKIRVHGLSYSALFAWS